MKTNPMPSCAWALLLILPSAISALSHAAQNSRSFLAGSLQPEVVAQTLTRVQDEWIAEAAAFADCHGKGGVAANCGASQQAFGRSCARVVDAIVQGSSGDQNMVREYMNTVCAEKSLTTVHRDHCLGLQHAIDGGMQFNEGTNRMNFNSAKLCDRFWSTFADAEKKRAEAERKAQKEMLIKANERAKALAEKRRQEEAHRQALEAQRKAEEAKERANKARKEAAAQLARKKAEAETLARLKQAALKAAQEKVKKAALEAAKAAEEHRQRLLEHQKAEERLRNITIAHQKANAVATSSHAAATSAALVKSSHQAAELVKPNVQATPPVKAEVAPVPKTNVTVVKKQA